MDIGSRIRSGVRWLGVSKGLVQAYTWILTIITMRILPPQVYGLIAIATIFTTFLSLFEELGVRTKLVQMKDYTHEYLRSLYGLSIVTNCLLATCLIAAAPFISLFFDQRELTAVVIVLALQFIVSSFGVIPDAMIARQLNFRAMALIDASQAVAAASLTLLFALRGFGVWSLVYGTIAGTIARTFGQILASPVRVSPSFDFANLLPTLRFGGLVVSQRLVWWAYSSLDRFVVGRFFNIHQLGLYSAASQFATMPLDKAGATLNLVSFSGLSRVADDPSAFRYYLLRACRMIAVVMFPLFFGIAAIAYEIVPVVFGSRWQGMETLMQIIALSLPARCLSLPLTVSLNSLGRPGENLKCGVYIALSFATGILMGSNWGLQGIAVGIVVASMVALATTLSIVGRNTGIAVSQVANEIWRPLVASIVMLGFLLAIRPLVPISFPSIGGLFFSIVAGASVYVGLIAIGDREALGAL